MEEPWIPENTANHSKTHKNQDNVHSGDFIHLVIADISE